MRLRPCSRGFLRPLSPSDKKYGRDAYHGWRCNRGRGDNGATKGAELSAWLGLAIQAAIMVFGGGAMWALVKRSAQRGEKLGEEGTRLGEENKASIKEHALRLEGDNKDISHLSGTVARLQVEHDGLE